MVSSLLLETKTVSLNSRCTFSDLNCSKAAVVVSEMYMSQARKVITSQVTRGCLCWLVPRRDISEKVI
jgi:hypothetical protein